MIEKGPFDITTGDVTFNTEHEASNYRDPEQDQAQAEYDFDPKQLRVVAEKLVNDSLNVTQGDRLLIQFHTSGWQLCSMVAAIAREKGAEVVFRFNDTDITQRHLQAVSERQYTIEELEIMTASGLDWKQRSQKPLSSDVETQVWNTRNQDEFDDVAWSNKVLIIRNTTSNQFEIDKVVKAADAAANALTTDLRVNQRKWCLIYVPTPQEAKNANLPVADYMKMFWEAGDRPWTEVAEAQKILVDILKEGNVIQIKCPAPEGMDDLFSVDVSGEIGGKVFAASDIKRNFPGSEVFGSTNKGTLKGHFGIPYPVMMDAKSFGKRILPNVWFDFENGVIVKAGIVGGNKEDEEFLAMILEIEGAKTIGELGFGTNPVITDIPPNTLMAEKALGIHFALGEAYPDGDYQGQDVIVDNGSRSLVHIDVPRALSPKYGNQNKAPSQILLDGKVIQENGMFVDQRLRVLSDKDYKPQTVAA